MQVDADVEIDPEDITSEDMVALAIQARKRPENVSYFAFTATPKAKTLELFGRKGPEGTPLPFHVYSMRQAIEEGFILDVLKHYTSYSTFYKLGAIANDKLVPQKRAKMALAQYAKLHPHNIAQKFVIVVEHFREHVAAKMGGKAKALVVTDSRKAAVRYKLAIDRYIKDQKYTDLRTLVAFSGAVQDPDSGPDEFTESNMNDIKGQEPSEAFKQEEYRILLVASTSRCWTRCTWTSAFRGPVRIADLNTDATSPEFGESASTDRAVRLYANIDGIQDRRHGKTLRRRFAQAATMPQ